ncbi:hypothetical protein JY412_01535 [Stenotrophomonas maltophilia]|nr:hypothetical protein [Stenotrophomonas maltophilia]
MSGRIGLSVWAFVGTLSFAFLSGAIATWLSFEVRWTFSFKGGPLANADWWAAAGTWVIGIAAAAIAVRTYSHSRSEANTARLRHLEATRLLVVDALVIEGMIQRFLDAEDQRKTWEDFIDLINSVKLSCAEVKVDSASLSHIPYAALGSLIVINRRMQGLVNVLDTTDVFARGDNAKDAVVGSDQLDALRRIRDFAAKLGPECDEFYRAIDAEIAKIR